MTKLCVLTCGRLEEKLTPTKTKRKFRILQSITFVVDDVTRQNHNLSKVEGVFFNVCVNGSYKPKEWGISSSSERVSVEQIPKSPGVKQDKKQMSSQTPLRKRTESRRVMFRYGEILFSNQRDFRGVLLGKTFTFHNA